MLMWLDEGKFIQYGSKQVLITEKPQLSFDFYKLKYCEAEKFMYPSQDLPHKIILSQSQITEIESFIKTTAEKNISNVFGVDKVGKFLGYVPPNTPQIFKIVFSAPPEPTTNNFRYNFVTHMWDKYYFYNKDGYQVDCDSNDVAGKTQTPPPHQSHALNYIFDVGSQRWNRVNVANLHTDLVISILHDSIKKYLLHNITVLTENDPTKTLPYLNTLVDCLINNTQLWVQNNDVVEEATKTICGSGELLKQLLSVSQLSTTSENTLLLLEKFNAFAKNIPPLVLIDLDEKPETFLMDVAMSTNMPHMMVEGDLLNGKMVPALTMAAPILDGFIPSNEIVPTPPIPKNVILPTYT